MYKYCFMNQPLQNAQTPATLSSLSHGMSYGMALLTAKQCEVGWGEGGILKWLGPANRP